MQPNTFTFSASSSTWVMRITADRRIEVNEGVDVNEAAQKVLDALQHLLLAQRPWVGLTDEEMLDIERNTTCEADESWLRNVTCNIEDALRSKNT
jgi:hypothetical protein